MITGNISLHQATFYNFFFSWNSWDLIGLQNHTLRKLCWKVSRRLRSHISYQQKNFFFSSRHFRYGGQMRPWVCLHNAFNVFTGAMIIHNRIRTPRVILCPIHMYTFEPFKITVYSQNFWPKNRFASFFTNNSSLKHWQKSFELSHKLNNVYEYRLAWSHTMEEVTAVCTVMAYGEEQSKQLFFFLWCVSSFFS